MTYNTYKIGHGEEGAGEQRELLDGDIDEDTNVLLSVRLEADRCIKTSVVVSICSSENCLSESYPRPGP